MLESWMLLAEVSVLEPLVTPINANRVGVGFKKSNVMRVAVIA